LADTTVNVTIRAQVAGYLQGMNQVAQATHQANTEAQNLQAQSEGFSKVGKGLLTIGAAAAAAVAVAVKSFADFDAQMSQVKSLSHATATEMDTLRNAALTMGQGIGFSATQVAEAETELVKAGVSVKDIMGGSLKGALDLAAAGQIDVAQATEIAATAMTQFGLAGKDIPHVADLLAAGADKSLGGVEELGMALKQSGLVANQFGLTVDQTVGTLAEFASAGLMGSDAGTSLKQMFLQLATPTKQAQQAMEKYHISAYDAQGDFVGMTALAGQLQAGFKGVDDASRDSALGIIFGSDAIRAANILYTDGAKGNRDWTNSVNEAGFAAAQAAGKTDNLNGDIKKLGAAFETGLIKSGSASNSVLRDMVQNLTGLVQALANAPQPVQSVALGLTALVAATALAGGGFLTMIPKIAAARLAMQQLQISGGRLAAGLGIGSAAILGVAALASGVAALGSQAELTDGQLKKLNAAMTGGSKALNAQFVGGSKVGFDAIASNVTTARDALKQLDDGSFTIGASKFVDGLSFGLLKTSATAKRFEAQFKQMGATLATTAETDVSSAAQGFNKLVSEMGGGQDTAKRLLDRMSPYKEELEALAGAQGKTVNEQELLNLAQGKGALAASLAEESTQGQKDQLAELSGVASQANDQISQLADSIRDFGSTQLSVEQTESDFQAAVDDATAALKENGKVLTANGEAIDLNSDKGRANAAALRQIAQDGVAATAAIVENGGSQADAASKMQTTRDAYIKAAQAFGLSGDEAAKMADQLRLVPENVSTLFKQQGADDVSNKAKQVKGDVDRVPSAKETKLRGDLSDAKAKLSDLKGQLASVPKSKSTKLNAEVAAARAAVQDLQRQINALPASKTTTLTTVNRTVAQNVTAGNTAFASGGHVRGPGSGTSDSIPAMLSNGEYVIRAASVQKYGQHTFDRLNAGHYADGGLVQHFASGGGVQYQYEKGAGNFNGLQGVSQLNSMFGDGSLSIALRNQAGLAALSYQRSLTGLTNASDKAASKLTDLQGSAASLKSSVASAVGNFDVGNYRSASSLSRGLSKSAGQVKEFAGLLTTLSKKGISGALLSEIASLGTAEGLPLARSLAAASASDIKSINSSYASIQSTAAKAGQTVADANYKAQIAAADKNARSLEAQIARQSVAIQRIIARGFGVKGYASGGYTGELGTGAVAGVVHGREFVVNAAATARNRMILEAMNAGGNVRYMSADRAPAPAAPQPVHHREVTYQLSVQDPTAVAQAIERRERAEYV
jgi:TP901 family phage tail tape measure protein